MSCLLLIQIYFYGTGIDLVVHTLCCPLWHAVVCEWSRPCERSGLVQFRSDQSGKIKVDLVSFQIFNWDDIGPGLILCGEDWVVRCPTVLCYTKRKFEKNSQKQHHKSVKLCIWSPNWLWVQTKWKTQGQTNSIKRKKPDPKKKKYISIYVKIKVPNKNIKKADEHLHASINLNRFSVSLSTLG